MKRHVTAVSWLAAALAERYDREKADYRAVELEIPDTEAIPDSVRHFDEAGNLARSYKTSDAIRAYALAASASCQAGAFFFAALARHEQALCLDSADASLKGLADALALVEQSLELTVEALMAQAAKKAVARAELGPREQLKEQILENIEQYQLLLKSRLLKVRRDVIDNIIGDQEFSRAEFYAREAVEEAVQSFGMTHFWTGIMTLRLAETLSRQEKHEQSHNQADAAIVILHEYVDEDRRMTKHPLAIEYRHAICLRRAALSPLP